MRTTSYRLGEYKIIDTGSGAFWWEAHAGLGTVQSGRCYRKGEILLFAPGESEEPGYLKREFLEKLKDLPKWDCTKYFCSNFSIHYCQSGKKLSESEISKWSGRQSAGHVDSSPGRFDESTLTEDSATSGEISYRLGQHEIIRKADGQILWKSCSGTGSLQKGRCLIAGDTLFVSAGEAQELGNLRHAFAERLSQLPPWTATDYYCPSCAVYDCRTGESLFRHEGGQLPVQPRRVPAEGVFSPSVRAMPSSTSLLNRPRTSFTHSGPSLLKRVSVLKEFTANLCRGAEQKINGVKLKYKRRRKEVDPKYGTPAPEVRVRRFPVKKWIGWIGALVLILGLLLLAILHDQWKSWERHHKDHSAGHHRHH